MTATPDADKTDGTDSAVHPVDRLRPIHTLIPFAIQHVLVMVATPISSVFLIATALGLDARTTSAVLSAVFVFSGLGSILQSVGVWRIGVRLPFVMLPGGAATILFITIAQGTDVETAVGAVLLTGVFYILAVTLFVKVLKFFPPLVIGIMVIVIGINLVQITGKLIVGEADAPDFGDPQNLLLGLITIGITVLCFRFLRGMLGKLSVAVGLVGGTIVGAFMGATDFSPRPTARCSRSRRSSPSGRRSSTSSPRFRCCCGHSHPWPRRRARRSSTVRSSARRSNPAVRCHVSSAPTESSPSSAGSSALQPWSPAARTSASSALRACAADT